MWRAVCTWPLGRVIGSAWLGCRDPLIKLQSGCMLLWSYFFRYDYYLNHWLWVKQITSIMWEGLFRGKIEVPRKGRNSASILPLDPSLHHWIPPEFPACQPASPVSDLSALTIVRNSFLQVNQSRSLSWMSICINILLVRFSGDHWLIYLPVIPSSDILALVWSSSLECRLT